MKFGHDLHRHVVPQWSQHYADYNLLKRLAKSYDSQEVHKALKSTISSLDSFVQNHLDSFDAAEAELCDSFDLGTEPTVIPNAHVSTEAELAHLVDTYSQFKKDMQELHWYVRVNTEGVEKIFAKLSRQEGAEHSSITQAQTLWWSELQLGWTSKVMNRLERLDGIITDISAQLTLSDRDSVEYLFLSRAFRQNLCPHLDKDAALRYILDGHTNDLVRLLDTTLAKLDPDRSIFWGLLHELLKFSAVFMPVHFKALTTLLPPKERFVIESEVLQWSLIAVGRRWRLVSNSGEMSTKHRYAHTVEARNVLNSFDLYRSSEILLARGASRRNPIHYAAEYGMAHVCEDLIKASLTHVKTRADLGAIWAMIAPDNEGLTPLHLAVTGNFTDIAICIIEAVLSHDRFALEFHRKAKEIMGETLQIAVKSQNDAIVRRLVNAGIDISSRSSRGETALHVAAQLGRADYVSLLLQSVFPLHVDLDVRETSQGWTPLFIACVYGHYDVVKLLLQAGPSKPSVDLRGWTARELAVFKGHLAVADLFTTSGVPGFQGGPASLLKGNQTVDTSPYCGVGEKTIIASLGINHTNRIVTALKLSNCSSTHTPGSYGNQFYSLEVSAPGSASKPRRLRLPILEDIINDPFVSPIPETTDAQLVFRIIHQESSSSEESVIGCGTALLESNTHQFGAHRQSLIREQTVPILETKTMGLSGTVTFTSFIATSFPHLQTPRQIELARPPPTPPVLVGHRGLGQNVKTHEYLQLGENTVESFISAAKLGASFVEFDVQVTRDLQAVAFHDFSLSESGTDVAVHDLTLDQFLHASNIQSPHGNPLSVLGQIHSRMEPRRPRSRSLGRGFEAGAIQTRDRMKHTVDFKQKGFKPNTRGDFIQNSFATLKEILAELPQDIGCDIEIKHPRLHEAVDAGVAPVGIELNTFVDVILDLLHQYGGHRQIMLSSFTPEICILLSMKQKAYPVLFITNAGKVPMSDMEVRAASVQVAVQFAKRWNLAGVVFACDALVLCPRLVGFVKARGLVCATYGGMNNEPGTVKLQADAGVDIIVADRVGLIAKSLGGFALPN